MPKELFEIKDFQVGTITTMSETDLPPTAASLSFNLDPYAQDGKLKGVQGSKIFTTTGWQTLGSTGISGFDGEYSSIINNKGVRTLVFYDHGTNKYKHVKDIDATSSQSILDTFTQQNPSNVATMVPNNAELHIGRGDLEPQWLGYPEYKQFGIDNSDSLILEAATLEPSSHIDAFYKVVSVVEGDPAVRYIYAVKYKGNYVFKFQQSGGSAYTLVSKSAYRFGSIQGIALRYSGITSQVDGLYTQPVLWIYDASVGEHGTVYQYDGSSITTGQENALTVGPTRSASEETESLFSDIMEHDGKLWFGRGYDGKTEFEHDLIWNANIPNAGESISPVNRTPKLVDFYGTLTYGSNSEVSGWTTAVEKGNFSLIPVDSLTVDDSGGVDQCFSVPIGAPQKKWFYSSYGGGSNSGGSKTERAATPRTWMPSGSSISKGGGIMFSQSTHSRRAKFSDFRHDVAALHEVCTADEIGPLFGGYWANNPPVPRNQNPRFSSSHGWNWVNINMPNSTGSGTLYHPMDGSSALYSKGIAEAQTRSQVITTKSGKQNEYIPYEFHGYQGTAGTKDPRGLKIVDNNYDRSTGWGTQNEHSLRWYYHGAQTDFQHTPDDYIDKEWGLIFWGSNDFKGADARKSMDAKTSWIDFGDTGTYTDNNAIIAAMHGSNWGDGNISSTTNGNMDLRRVGQTQIDHRIYSRKFNRHDGTLNENGTNLIGDMTEGGLEGWNHSGDWIESNTGIGIRHATATTTALKCIGDPDTMCDGTQYTVEYDITAGGGGTVTFIVGGSSASGSITGGTGSINLTSAASLYLGKVGTTTNVDYSTDICTITPTSNFTGTINDVKVYATPKTYSILLPTSFNNAGDSNTIHNIPSKPIGVNYTTQGYRTNKSYSSFNMSDSYNTGDTLPDANAPNDEQQYHEVGTNFRESGNITAVDSTRLHHNGSTTYASLGLKVRRAFNFVNEFPTSNTWTLNDFAGQHMPFDRHIMAVDSDNKYIFVVNPLHKGYGYPNTDVCEIDTGATRTHCTENEFTKTNAAISTDTITFSGGVDTTNLWEGMTVSHADIPVGAYITKIESSTVIKINTNATGTPTGQTITFGRFISTDQGTGGNRNVVYIYSYDENGNMKYKGFKHLVRDCIHDYRGLDSLAKGAIADSNVVCSDVYATRSTGEYYLIFNMVFAADAYKSGDENGLVKVTDRPRSRRHSILKIRYSPDLSTWESPTEQSGMYSTEQWYEDPNAMHGNATLIEKHTRLYTQQDGNSNLPEGWASGAIWNTTHVHTNSSGGGGLNLGQTAYCDHTGILFKVVNEEKADAPTSSGYMPILYALGARARPDRFDHVSSWGFLELASPAFSGSISDLSPEYGNETYGVSSLEHMPFDFIALDKASRIIYVGTSQRVEHPQKQVSNAQYEQATVTYTSIQSFPYYPNTLGNTYSADEGEEATWANIRLKEGCGPAIDHIVISNIEHHNGFDSWNDNYSGSNYRYCNPFGGRYRQALVTNNESRNGVKYYTDDGEPINVDPFNETKVDPNGVHEDLPHGRYLILSGGGGSVSYKNTALSSNAHQAEIMDPCTMNLLKAIPVTVDGHFIHKEDRRREQDFFKSAGTWIDHGSENGHPYDVTGSTYTLTRTSSWGTFAQSGTEKTLDQVDSTDPLHHDYKWTIKDQDVWYQSRVLDGPILGYNEMSGTLFTMAGLRASENKLNDAIKRFDHSHISTDHEDTGRQFRLYSVNLMHHEPISSPLANLFPIKAKLTDTTVLAAEAESANPTSEVILTVDTTSATDGLFLNKYVYAGTTEGASKRIGICTQVVNSTTIKFGRGTINDIANNDKLFVEDDVFAGVLFGMQSRNMTMNKILTTSTLSANSSNADRKNNKNTLQTITGAKSRWSLGCISYVQVAGKTGDIWTGDTKASGLSSSKSRIWALGTDDNDVRLNWAVPFTMSANNLNNQVRANSTRVIGISQAYDDTRLTHGSSDSGKYVFTFGRSTMYDNAGKFNRTGLAMFSNHISDHSSDLLLHATKPQAGKIALLQNLSPDLDGHINMLQPYPLAISHGSVGASVTDEATDLGIHLFIGSAYNMTRQANSYEAGWALAKLDYSATNLYLDNTVVVGTGGKLADTLHMGVTNSTEGDWSTFGQKYFYRASFVYDGYQEGPLGDDYTLRSSDGHNIVLDIRIDTTTLSKRVSHINIYRGDNIADSNSPLGFYRLVTQLRLDSAWSLATDTNTSPRFGNFRFIEYTDKGYSGADYESNSGIPEVVDNSSLKFHYACELNNQLYVAKIGHRMIDNGDSIIAKSLPYNYDQFDITRDILRMPSTPTSIAEHGNRVWVFDEGNTYKVEPSNLYIEETYKGSGCFGQYSYVSTEYGLFYCDNSNIYAVMEDGVPRAIGSAIKTGSTYSWDNKDIAYTPRVGYDGNLKTVFFAIKISGSYYTWGYNLVNTRWDLYKFNNVTTEEIQSFTNDKYGNLLFNVKDGSGNHYLYQFGTDTTKHLDWEWVSKDFTLGHDNVFKKIYNIKSTGDGTIQYSVTSQESPNSSLVSPDKINTSHRKTKKIKLRVYSGSNGTNKYELDSLGIVFRRLKVTSS